MPYALKFGHADLCADRLDLPGRRAMYGGQQIAIGDIAYLFDSETSGGDGLFARAVVSGAIALARGPGETQAPQVDLVLQCTGRACRHLGRDELTSCTEWQDGRAETELNFKLFRDSSDKLVGISDRAAAFLEGHFDS